MKSVSNQKTNQLAVNDHLAKMLSGFIVKVQSQIALKFSKRFNGYSLRKQKFLFLIAGVLTAGILITDLFSGLYSIPALKQTYRPATHIGLASDINRPERATLKLTDSLTKNH